MLLPARLLRLLLHMGLLPAAQGHLLRRSDALLPRRTARVRHRRRPLPQGMAPRVLVSTKAAMTQIINYYLPHPVDVVPQGLGYPAAALCAVPGVPRRALRLLHVPRTGTSWKACVDACHLLIHVDQKLVSCPGRGRRLR